MNDVHPDPLPRGEGTAKFDSRNTGDLRFADRRTMILPLRGGESWGGRIRCGWLSFFILFSITASAQLTQLKADEQIIFYPSVAQRVPGETNLWRAEIHGCVFEVEKRSLLLATLREALDLKGVAMTAAEANIFNERVRLFFIDHQRGKNVFIRQGTNEFFVGKSGADGQFAGSVLFRDTDLECWSPTRRDDDRAPERAGS